MCIQSIEPYKQIIEIVSAMLTPLIGIIGAIIIIFQYRLSKLRWRLDLYEKRYAVFLCVKDYISSVTGGGFMNLSNETITKFLRGSKDYEFLFGNEIKDYLKELFLKGSSLQLYARRLEKTFDDKQRNETMDQIETITDWFGEQYDVSTKLFGAYLKIDKK